MEELQKPLIQLFLRCRISGAQICWMKMESPGFVKLPCDWQVLEIRRFSIFSDHKRSAPTAFVVTTWAVSCSARGSFP